MFKESSASELTGDVSWLSERVRQGEHAALISYINKLLQADCWELGHPLNGTLTKARASRRIRFANVVFFADANNQNRWALIQTGDFVNGAFVDGVLYQLHANSFGHQAVKNVAIDLVRKPELEELYSAHGVFSGVLVAHKRPAHFFYDQLLNVPELNIPAAKVLAYDHECFLDPALLSSAQSVPAQANSIYIAPATIAGDVYRAQQMEQQLAQLHMELPASYLAANKRLWIGVANEKRCWIDQVDGYINTINELAKHIDRLSVVFDGFTAFHGQTIPAESDNALLDQIKHKLAKNVAVFSVIGCDYKTKIAYAAKIDGFVSYVGTQSMVPLRFVKSSGVLHSNTVYGANESYPSGQGIYKIPADQVTDIPSSSTEKSDFMSYFFHWQLLYNRLLKVLKINVDELAVPTPKELDELPKSEFSEAEHFSQLGLRLKPFSQSADLFREAGDLFAEAGDFKMAAALLEKALLLRPEGKLIQLKLKNYQHKASEKQ